MEINISIGKRLREVREAMGCSQSEFAQVAGLAGVPGSTRQSQAKYENGTAAPSAPYLAALANAGVDVGYVVTGKRGYVPVSPLTAEEQTMLDYFRQAPPAVRRAALGALIGAPAPVAQGGDSGVKATVKRSLLGFASARGGDKKGKP